MHKKCGKQLNTNCSIALAAKIIGDLWTILIVRDLLKGKKRFKEFEESLEGISTKTLCTRLTLLEEQKLLKRNVYHETPPRVEYELTDKGKLLQNIITEIETFGKILIEEPQQS